MIKIINQMTLSLIIIILINSCSAKSINNNIQESGFMTEDSIDLGTSSSRNQRWEIVFMNGQFIENAKPTAVRDQLLFVEVGEEIRSFPIRTIVELKVPQSKLSNIGRGMKKGFLWPFKNPSEFTPDIEFETLSEAFILLLFLPVILLLIFSFMTIAGVAGAIIGGIIGAFQNNLEVINLYELPVIDKVELIKNLIN